MFVRARPKGITIEQACERYRQKSGARVGTVEYLKKKYERCAHAYPDFAVNDWVWLANIGEAVNLASIRWRSIWRWSVRSQATD
jgi:hypothetical protein